MVRLKWGEGPRMYDRGLDRGVLYLDDTAVPWNGLVSIEEKADGEVNVDHYFDGNRLHVTQVTGDYGARILAYTYPDIFSEYNGYGPHHEYKRFGLSYRTDNGDGYKLHLIYNVLVRDDVRSWSTTSNEVDPSLFNWDIYASAVEIPGASPASHLIMEIPQDATVFDELETVLYGNEVNEPRLPDPAELVELYESSTRLRIIYNGDGSYTATGPDDMVRLLTDGRFELNAPSVFLLEQDIFVVNSY